jgi:hypothetical protein
MRTSSNRPSRAKSAARAASPAPSRHAPQGAARQVTEGATLAAHDPAALRAWLRDVRTQSRDVVAAGLDATAPLGERDLGRRAARRIIVDAESALEALFASAAGLFGEEDEDAAKDASTPAAAVRADRRRPSSAGDAAC